jgi:hypothetical protein
MINKIKLIMAVSLLVAANTLHAQNVDALLQQYPGQLAVFTNCSKAVNIKLNSGNLSAESEEENEFIILDEKAQGLYNKYKVYHSHFNELKSLEAFTKVPDGNRFKKVKVVDFKTQDSRSSGVFYDDVKETSFDFPQVSKGAICIVQEKQLLQDIHLLPSFHFYNYMPVDKFNYLVTAPVDVDVKFIINNNKDSIIKMTQYRKGKTNYWEFSAQHVATTDRYGNAPASAYYQPHVLMYIASYKVDDKEQNVLSSLDDLYKWNYSFLKNVNITKSDTLQALVDSVIKGASSQKEKAVRLYEWVQSNIKYIAFEQGLEGFTPRQAVDVCTKKYGDCKDMCSLITTLLRIAGIEAYYTWIGTRDIPYKHTEVYLPCVDNHMISTAKIDGQWYFLDGTDPNCIFGFPSGFTQGKQALLAINETEYKVLEVPVIDAAKNTIIDSTFITFTEKGIKGNMSVHYNGYCGVDALNALLYKQGDDERDYVKYRMGKASNKFIMGNYSIAKPNPREKTVNIKADFEVPDYGKKIADEMYINLNLEKLFVNSIIDTAKRKVGIENDYKNTIRQFTILTLPVGYTVSYQPKNFSQSNDIFDIKIQYTNTNNTITAMQEIVYKVDMVQPQQFNQWNSIIQKLLTQYKEQVVLKKQ